MLWARRFRIRIRSLVNKRAEDEELERELAFHLAELKAEHMSRCLILHPVGWSPTCRGNNITRQCRAAPFSRPSQENVPVENA